MKAKLINPELRGMSGLEGLANLRATFRDLRLSEASSESWEAFALNVFAFQYDTNGVYRRFCEHLGVGPEDVSSVWDVPFLPVETFATHRVLVAGVDSTSLHVFRSSGTTGSRPSEHYVDDLEWYREVACAGAEMTLGPLNKWEIHALLPGYLERPDASLVHMVRDWLFHSNPKLDVADVARRFHLQGFEALEGALKQASPGRRKLLIGVTHALLDWADALKGPIPDAKDWMILETGGMKGRRKEWIREAIHENLGQRLGVQRIGSEYGMTEMMSQAYALQDGLFQVPPWLLVGLREMDDPKAWAQSGRQGRICIVDLANLHSCAFLATGDIGRRPDVHSDGFEVLGRHDHAEIRGCNLMVSDF